MLPPSHVILSLLSIAGAGVFSFQQATASTIGQSLDRRVVGKKCGPKDSMIFLNLPQTQGVWNIPNAVDCDIRPDYPTGSPAGKHFGPGDIMSPFRYGAQCLGDNKFAAYWYVSTMVKAQRVVPENLRVRMQVEIVGTGDKMTVNWQGAEFLKDTDKGVVHVSSCGHSGWKGHADLAIGK